MIFNTNKIVSRDLTTIKSFSLKSYSSIFKKSLSLRCPNSMILYQYQCDIETDLYEYDYIDYIDSNNNFKLPKDLELLYLDEFLSLDDIPNLSECINLKYILNGATFTKPITAGVLPSSLVMIEFGDCFNEILITGVLPSSLKEVYFGDEFNQPIMIGTFPNSIETIVFGSDFNQPLDTPGIFPESLHTLIFGIYFSQKISANVLPQHLELLQFAHSYSYFPEHLPPGIVSLTLSDRVTLPIEPNFRGTERLTSLFKYPIEYIHLIPKSVKKLSLAANKPPRGVSVPLTIGTIPNHIEYLNFYSLPPVFKLSEGIIPPSVTNLNLGLYFDSPLEENSIGGSVKILHLGFRFDQLLKRGDIPNSVEELHYGEFNIRPILPNVLPHSIRVLDLGSRYNCVIERDVLPPQLERIKFGLHYDHPIKSGVLPSSLKHISFYHNYCCNIDKNAIVSNNQFEDNNNRNHIKYNSNRLLIIDENNTIQQANIDNTNYINNNSSNSIELKDKSITLHIGIIFFLHNKLEDLPTDINSIEFDFKLMRFNIRRISEGIFIGNSSFFGGFVDSKLLNKLAKDNVINDDDDD